jgi:hypothetical protein
MTKPLASKSGLWKVLAPPALTLLLLGGALADKVKYHLPPSDAAPYHARVKAAADSLAMFNVGPWIGSSQPLPPAAVNLLHPNTWVSRQYQDVRTGRTASFLIVQCEDARDLIGHYPPVCYVAHGWSLRSKVPAEREVDGEKIPLTQYTFTSSRMDRSSELRVDNFMVLPDGQMGRDMDSVEAAAQNYRRKFFGAAQVQFITDAEWGEAEREDLFRQLIEAAGPLLREMRSGVKQ